MRHAIVVALLLLAACSLFQAQDRALISGDAQDKQDVPVPGVQVTLSNDSLGITRTATTNANGYYFFAEVVPAEGYVMKATSPGMTFAPSAVRFDVEVGETRHILPSFIAGTPAGPTASIKSQRLAEVNSDSRSAGGPCSAETEPVAIMLESRLMQVDVPFVSDVLFLTLRQPHVLSGECLSRSQSATKPILIGDFRCRQVASANVFLAVPGEGECFGSV